MLAFVQSAKEGTILCVRVQPRASRDEIVGATGDYVRLRVKAPPVEGAANEACVRFLSELFAIPKRDVQVVSGAKSRRKRILLKHLEEEAVKTRISEAAQDFPT